MAIPDFNLVPGRLDINAVVGDDFSVLLDFNVDLTGYTFDARVLLDNNPYGRYQSITITNTNLPLGRITLSLTDTQTRTIGPISKKKWFISWTQGGDIRTVLSGGFSLNQPYAVTDYSPTTADQTIVIQTPTILVEVIGGVGGAVVWGDIQGDIEDQTDLIELLSTYINSPRIITTSSVIGIGNADLSSGSVTFGTDFTTQLQGILNQAADGPLTVIWDGAYSCTGLTVTSNTTIQALEGCGAILRNSSNKPLLANANPGTGTIIDQNITVSGGIWNGNSAGQLHDTEEEGWIVGMRFMAVRNLLIENLTILKPRTFAVHCANWENIKFLNVNVFVGNTGINQDGLHINGPGRALYGRNLVAETNDDALAISANDIDSPGTGQPNVYGPYAGPGDITDVDFEGITFLNSESGIRLLSSVNLVDRVSIRGIKGNTQRQVVIIDCYTENNAVLDPPGPGNFGNITIDGIDADLYGEDDYKHSYIYLGAKGRSLTVSNVNRFDWTDNRPFLLADTATEFDSVTINTCNFTQQEEDQDTQVVRVYGSIQNLTLNQIAYIRNSAFAAQISPLVQLFSSSDVETLTLTSIYADGLRNIVYAESAALGRILSSDLTHLNSDGYPSFGSSIAIPDLDISGYAGPLIYSGAGSVTNKNGSAWLNGLLDQPTAGTLAVLKNGGTSPILQMRASPTGNPEYQWYYGNGASDSRLWSQYVFGNTMYFRLLNDINSAETVWLTVTRSAMSVTAVAFQTPITATNLSGTNTGDQYGGATASAANQYLRRNAANNGYEFGPKTEYIDVSPTDGQAIAFNDNPNDQVFYITPPGDLTDLQLILPSNATSIQTQKVVFCSTTNIATLALTGATTIYNAPVSMNAGDCFQFYKMASNVWARVIT